MSELPGQAEPIRVDDVSRSFGDVVAIDRVTMTVPHGALLGLIGPSGSGKTTLIRMLTGTLRPTSGEIRVLGQHPHSFLRTTRERIGYVPQDFVLYPDLTASENVAFIASLFGIFWWRRRRRVREVLELLGLWEVRNRRAKDLSGGMRRRLEVACGLVHEPSVLFIDEPTAEWIHFSHATSGTSFGGCARRGRCSSPLNRSRRLSSATTSPCFTAGA